MALGEPSQLFPAIQVIPSESPHFHADTTTIPAHSCPNSWPTELWAQYNGGCFMPLSTDVLCHNKTKTAITCFSFSALTISDHSLFKIQLRPDTFLDHPEAAQEAKFHFLLIFYQLILASSHLKNEQFKPLPFYLVSFNNQRTSQLPRQIMWGSQLSMTIQIGSM